ncbi:unnamed protein product [marine sediment metagenome]|uniref:DUF4082 domain-containing protein n=1 Tax=marine sediment metagenome TaxID=412755 RepID=X1KCU0_9ZZZZ
MTTLYEHYEEFDNAVAIYGDNWWGQSFTPSITHIITSISILCYRIVGPGTVGDLTAGIYLVDENGYPTGNALCSGTINGDLITTDTDGEWAEITLDLPYVLEAGTQYAIVVHADDAEILHYIKWKNEIVGSYAGGVFSQSADGGVNWIIYASDGSDGAFREYGDTIPTILPAIELSLQGLWGW